MSWTGNWLLASEAAGELLLPGLIRYTGGPCSVRVAAGWLWEKGRAARFAPRSISPEGVVPIRLQLPCIIMYKDAAGFSQLVCRIEFPRPMRAQADTMMPYRVVRWRKISVPVGCRANYRRVRHEPL